MKGVIAGVAVLALLIAGAAAADTTGTVLTLNPVSHGAMTRASWQAGEGRPDAQGQASQALVLEAPGTADTSAAALFRGFEGIRVRDIQSLAYEHRLGTTCNKTDPRWTLFIRGKKERTYLVNLGCAITPPRPTDDPKWVQRVYALPLIQAEIVRQVPAGLTGDALNGVVEGLALVVDRSSGAAYLDNVAVRTRPAAQVWTYAGDNAAGVPGAPAFTSDELSLLAAPLADTALWDEADVLTSVTSDEQALIDASNASTD